MMQSPKVYVAFVHDEVSLFGCEPINVDPKNIDNKWTDENLERLDENKQIMVARGDAPLIVYEYAEDYSLKVASSYLDVSPEEFEKKRLEAKQLLSPVVVLIADDGDGLNKTVVVEGPPREVLMKIVTEFTYDVEPNAFKACFDGAEEHPAATKKLLEFHNATDRFVRNAMAAPPAMFVPSGARVIWLTLGDVQRHSDLLDELFDQLSFCEDLGGRCDDCLNKFFSS